MKFNLRVCGLETIISFFALSIVYCMAFSSYAENDPILNRLEICEHADGPVSITNYEEVLIYDTRLDGKDVLGAAICNDATISELSQNNIVKFSDNLTFGCMNGGACIANTNDAEFRIINNDAVVVINNLSDTDNKYWNAVRGGALYNDASFLIKKNIDVSFIDNVAHGRSGAQISNGRVVGGAIYSDGRRIDDNSEFLLENNGNVLFVGNGVISDSYMYAQGGAICNGAQMSLKNNNQLVFVDNYSFSTQNSLDYYTQGGAIANWGMLEILGGNILKFEGNCVRLYMQYHRYYGWSSFESLEVNGGGAIYNNYNAQIKYNHDISFADNAVECELQGVIGGGAILNTSQSDYRTAVFVLSDNDKINFSHNKAVMHGYSRCAGGAIYNGEDGTGKNRGERIFKVLNNDFVSFSGNEVHSPNSAYAGAIFNGRQSSFEISGNQSVNFSANIANGYAYGGAIYNERGGLLSISGNMHVLFEKNVEISPDWYSYDPADTYRLRSIYSNGTLQLSAKENGDIVFRDSIYATGDVFINKDYVDAEGHECKSSGMVVISGLTTIDDLKEMKGGVSGTMQEILNSRTSEIYTTLGLYGGTLSIEDGAILKGYGISVADDAQATLSLKNGAIDETGYAVTLAAGNTMAFFGENILTAGALDLRAGAILAFNLDDAGTDMLELDAQLLTNQLYVNITGSAKGVQRLITLQSSSQYDVSGWSQDKITVSGAAFEDLVWEDGVLSYNPYDKFEINLDADTTVAGDSEMSDQLSSGETVKIDTNGHSLTVKNEVQLVQMALKNGTVKLEGENNGVVSVTLTEGGELVLTAGAGLKTGDIISMVASGKGELVISGDITLDNKGMKGKAGAQATVSHADAQVLGDATISNVRVEDSVIDLAEGSTVGFEHVVLAATTRITDDPATANLDDVTAELVMGVNASLTGSDMLMAGTTLEQSGNTGVTLTLSDDASVLMLEATTFDSLTLSGSTLVLELAGMTLEMFDNAELIAVSFTSGTGYASFDKSLAVTLSVDGINYERGYTLEADDTPTTMYFRGGKKPAATPEPATTTLSLLALAALATRRKRK